MNEELAVLLGEVRGELKGTREALVSLATRLDRDLADKERRLRSVERKQIWMSGAFAAVAFVFAKVDLTQVVSILNKVSA